MNIMGLLNDEKTCSAELDTIDMIAIQSDLHDNMDAVAGMQVAAILSAHTDEFSGLPVGKTRDTVVAMYEAFGAGCTVESFSSKYKELKTKTKETLKHLWAKFTEFVKMAVLNLDGALATNAKLVLKVSSMGRSLRMVDPKKQYRIMNTSVLNSCKTIAGEVVSVVGWFAGEIQTGNWGVLEADMASNEYAIKTLEKLKSAEEFWKEYREANKKESITVSDLKSEDIHQIVDDVQDYRYWARSLQGLKKDLKPLRFEGLNIEAGSINPDVVLRRVISLINLNVIELARFIRFANTILEDVRPDDGNE